MTIDWSISVGAIIIAGTNLLGLIVVAWRLSLRFNMMERKVNLMFAWFLRQISGKSDAITTAEMREFFGVEKIE